LGSRPSSFLGEVSENARVTNKVTISWARETADDRVRELRDVVERWAAFYATVV
jgi:hypothetical protein